MTYVAGETPNQQTLFDMAFERWELNMQTAFPAKVVDLDLAEAQTVNVEPAFFEAWYSEEERVSVPMPVIQNVPILFPRGNGYSIYIPPAVDDWVLVICCKYSIDRWREQARANDPGDLRRFTLDGAVAIPGIAPDGGELAEGKNAQADAMVITIPGELHLGKHNPDEAIALATKTNDRFIRLEDKLDNFINNYNLHTHPVVLPTANKIEQAYTPLGQGSAVDSAKVKSE